MKKLFIPAVLLMVAILLFTGCGGGTTTTTPATTAFATATMTVISSIKTGGTLKILMGWSTASIPGWPGDATNNQRVWTNWIMYEGLVKIDNMGKPIPWLATNWTFGPENKYIDFNLRNDVSFHDGTKFTADSVVTYINELMVEKDTCTHYFDTIVKTGDYAVRLTLKQFRNDFWTNQIGAWDVVFPSDTQFKEKGLDYAKQHPVGTGPFIFKSFEKDVSMKFEKNPNYWQAGKPYLDAIEYHTVKETLTEQAQMETKEGDVMCLISDGKIVKDLKSKGMDVVSFTTAARYLMFDTANDGQPTNNPKVRMAIEYAINKQEMADTLGSGYMVAANQQAGKSSPAYNPNIGNRDYDPDKSKQLLKEAGYENGLTINLIADMAESTQQAMSVMLQSYLKSVGITVNIETVDNAKMWDYLFTGWNGFFCIDFGMSPSFAAYLSNNYPPWAPYNTSVKLPQEIIDKTNAAMTETDPAKFQTMCNELSQWVYDNDFFVPVVGVSNCYISQPTVKDADFLVKFIDFSYWSPEKCWLND